MKIHVAEPIGNESPNCRKIEIDKRLPKYFTGTDIWDEDAQTLAGALVESLPQATLIRLTALLLRKQADYCHIIKRLE